MNKKTFFKIAGALGITLLSGAGAKVAETVMNRTVEGNNEPDNEGTKPTPEECEELAQDCDLIK